MRFHKKAYWVLNSMVAKWWQYKRGLLEDNNMLNEPLEGSTVFLVKAGESRTLPETMASKLFSAKPVDYPPTNRAPIIILGSHRVSSGM
jgi:hypothetical protein